METLTIAAALLTCFSAAMAFTCPDDSHTFYHADVSTGCQVYHHCENSQLQTLSCPSGQAFNHVTLQCEVASAVECTETMPEHSHHHHEHHRHKRSSDFSCPDDVHTFYHADVSTNCQVYHLCQNSELQTLSCPSGQAFNHVTLQCEDASIVECTETMPEHSHHHHEHHRHKRSADFSCPDDAHTFYHADVSTNCQVYHLCQNSELQTLSCLSGQAFNHVTLQCEDASAVDCIETMPEHSHHHHEHHRHKRSADFSCPDDAHTFYHADVSTNCQVYHICQNSELQTLSCPSGQAFNHMTLQCEDASTVDCIETMPEHSHHHHEHHRHKRSANFNCPEDAHTFYHADVSTGCQVYHLCQNSELQTLSCPSGQAFNHLTLQCEDASIVECVETMGEHSHHHHEHHRHKRSADFSCPEDSHTFYHADVSSGCQVYHLCQNSELQTLTCPPGQAFNHLTLKCEDASTVECLETMGEHSHHHHEHHRHKRSADFSCPEDSHTFYHADVSSGCQVYHLCQNSELQTLSCPPGQAFNHLTLQCEDASTVECVETMGEHSHHHHEHHRHKRSADFSCPEDSHTFYHADVSSGCQVYHLCQNSELQTLSCPPGQAFNHLTLQCEDASTVECVETMAEHSHHHHEHHRHKRSADFSCPEDSHTFYHADVSSGCQVYHLCQNSELQTLSCPPGQAFNHLTLQCEDASTVECVETMAEHSHHHHEHHRHKRSADFSCPEDSHTFYHADVSSGCQVYHLCQNSELQTLSCPPGQAFNHLTLQCEDASTVECVETMGEHSHHHHEHHRHKRSADFSCPEDSHTFYHADVSSGCQVYHLCQNSELQTLSCPPGQAFNHLTLHCEDASIVDCVETMGEHSHHHHEHHRHKRSADFNCPEDSHAFYHADVSTGCQVYHLCQNSELQTLSCPEGEAFNHLTLQCEDGSTVDCVETMGENSHHHHEHHRQKRSADFSCPDDGHTFYHADVSTGCQVYHLCQNSELQTLSCTSGQAFSHLTLQCEDASTVDCIETMGEHSHHHHDHHSHKRSADFSCPDDAHTFYHADVSTGCQVYHLCQNSQLQTFTCPSGQAFNYVTSQCEDASNVDCTETTGEHSHHHHHQIHHHQKRSVYDSVLNDHEEYKSNKMTIYSDSLLSDYAQLFREQLGIFCRYYECNPNFNIGSFFRFTNEDYLLGNITWQDTEKDKVLSKSKENEHVINKRDTRNTDMNSVVDAVMYLTNKYARDTLYGNGTSFLFKIVMPIFYEMMENEQTRMDVLSVVISSKNVFKPVALQILKNQNPDDKFISIPRRIYENSVNEFLKENRIIFEKVIERHLKAFAAASQESVPFFVESFDRLKAGKYPHAEALKKAAVYFYQKHGKLLQTSTAASMKFYPVKEILEDAIPVKNALRQIFMDYFNLSEDSWLSFIFGDTHSVQNVPPKYTKPIPKLYSKKSAY